MGCLSHNLEKQKMKKIFLLLSVGLFIALSSQAQKLGYINAEELMASMPEYTKVGKDLEAYQKTFMDQGQVMVKEYQTKMDAYQKDEATLNDAMKTVRQKEIMDLQGRIQDLDSTMSVKMQTKQNELMKPILEKVRSAIQAVGNENGYQFIFDGGGLLFAKDADNVAALVKAKLGLK